MSAVFPTVMSRGRIQRTRLSAAPDWGGVNSEAAPRKEVLATLRGILVSHQKDGRRLQSAHAIAPGRFRTARGTYEITRFHENPWIIEPPPQGKYESAMAWQWQAGVNEVRTKQFDRGFRGFHG
jgi:hypothetical protein